MQDERDKADPEMVNLVCNEKGRRTMSGHAALLDTLYEW